MKLAIIGRTQVLYKTALRLAESGYKIKAVITTSAAPEYSKNENDFKMLAKKINAPYFSTRNLDKPHILNVLKGLDLGISMNWVSIFTQKQIGIFKIGILNAHLGDLPRYRGNATPNWAIINGEKEIVNSIHLTEPGKLDCGRVIIQERMSLGDDTYIREVYEWAEKITPKLFLKSIKLLRKDSQYSLKYSDISDPSGFRCFARRPEDSLIDWSKPAYEIHRLVRASSKPFPGAYTYTDNSKITIWKAELFKDSEKYLALPGQLTEVNPDFFVVISGAGKLKVTDYEPRDRIKSIRQRLVNQKVKPR